MNLATGFLRSLPCFLLAFSDPVSALSPARTLSFNMDKGNLVLNWSFENSLQAWESTPLAGFTVDPHYKYPAKSGSYVGLSDGAASGAGVNSTLLA